jgi:hypothetical protein
LDVTSKNSVYNKTTTRTTEQKKKRASEFEKQVEERLLKLGVQFSTEEDLRTNMGGVYPII